MKNIILLFILFNFLFITLFANEHSDKSLSIRERLEKLVEHVPSSEQRTCTRLSGEKMMLEWRSNVQDLCDNGILYRHVGFHRLSVAVDPQLPHKSTGSVKTRRRSRKSKIRSGWINPIGVTVGRNISLDISLLPIAFRSTRTEQDEMYLDIPSGVLSGHCEPTTYLEKAKTINQNHLGSQDGYWAANWRLIKSFEPSNGTPKCAMYFDQPVLLVERYEYANLYHSMMDFIGAWMGAEVAGVHWERTQVILFDAHEEALLDEVWSNVFSRSVDRPMARMENFRALNAPICFNKLIIAPTGHAVQFMKQPPVDCTHSSILDEFVAFFLDGMNIPHALKLSERKSIIPQVTLVVRRPYVAHPRNPTGKVVRQWHNERQVIDVLQGYCRQGDLCHLQVVDFAKLSIREQITLITETDILVGVHGAALTHLLFLPSHASVVEVGGRNMCFRILAEYKGTNHILIKATMGHKVNISPDQLVTGVSQAIDFMKSKIK